MRTFRADLHVHSVLSPCGDLAMSPTAIVARAVAIGLDVVGISDHNCARNAPALAAAAARAGITAWFGLEVRSSEEVDLLTVFDRLGEAMAFGAWVWERLPDVTCDTRVFGDQVVVTADDEIVEFVPRLLLGGLDAPLQDIADEAQRRGALVIPAHVDRAVDSVISQLGWLPDDLPVDAVEVTRFGDETVLAADHPWLARTPIVRFSDAHLLDDVGYQQTRFEVAEVSVDEARRALAGEDGRRAEPLRQALKRSWTDDPN